MDIDHIDKELTLKKQNKIVKFEDLKTNNISVIKNIYNFLKIKFNTSDLTQNFRIRVVEP